MYKFLFDSSLDISDSLPPLLFTGDCQCAEEIRDHEVCHPGDTYCKDFGLRLTSTRERLALALTSLFTLDPRVTYRTETEDVIQLCKTCYWLSNFGSKS